MTERSAHMPGFRGGISVAFMACALPLSSAAETGDIVLHDFFETCSNANPPPSDWNVLPRSAALDAAFYRAGSIGFIVSSDFALNPPDYDATFEERLVSQHASSEAWLSADVDAGLWTLIGHPSAWTAAVYNPQNENQFVYCWAWHDENRLDEIISVTSPTFDMGETAAAFGGTELPWSEYTTELTIEASDTIRQVDLWGVVFEPGVVPELARTHARLYHEIRELQNE